MAVFARFCMGRKKYTAPTKGVVDASSQHDGELPVDAADVNGYSTIDVVDAVVRFPTPQRVFEDVLGGAPAATHAIVERRICGAERPHTGCSQ